MSVIGKKPLIHEILSKLSNADLTHFEALLNNKLENPISLSLYDKHYYPTEQHKGVNYVKFHLDSLSKVIICGFLCYVDNENCALFGTFGTALEKMVSVKINLNKKTYKFLNEGLDVEELRREIYDMLNAKTGGDFSVNILSESMEGNETIVVDINEQGSKVVVKLDEDYKQALEEGMAHEIEITNVPATATNGQLELEDYLILVEFPRSTILFGNERYYPMDVGHEEGYLGYSHVGFENGVFMLKNITITQSNRTWVLNSTEVNGGGTSYQNGDEKSY